MLAEGAVSKSVEVVPIPLHPIIQFSFMFIAPSIIGNLNTLYTVYCILIVYSTNHTKTQSDKVPVCCLISTILEQEILVIRNIKPWIRKGWRDLKSKDLTYSQRMVLHIANINKPPLPIATKIKRRWWS